MVHENIIDAEVETKTIELNMADIGVKYVSNDNGELLTNVAMGYCWVVTYLPPHLNINPLLAKSIEFPKLDYNVTGDAVVKFTYYIMSPNEQPTIDNNTFEDGDAIFNFGQFNIKLVDNYGRTLKRGEGGATTNKFLVSSPALETNLVKSVTLPILDYAKSDLVGFGIEFYMTHIDFFKAKSPININKCPNCGGIADNGMSRDVPPVPYYCIKCTEELEQKTEDLQSTIDDWIK